MLLGVWRKAMYVVRGLGKAVYVVRGLEEGGVCS